MPECPTNLEYIFHPFYTEALYEISRDNGCLEKFELIEGNGTKRLVEYSLLDPNKEWRGRFKTENPFSGIPYDAEHNLQPLVQLATQAGMTAAFSSGFYSEKPRFFVFPVNVPEKFRPYVLLHEVRESDCQGVAVSCINDNAYVMYEKGEHDLAEEYLEKEMDFAYKFPHLSACLDELGQVFGDGQELSQEFSEWLMRFNSDPTDPTTFFNQVIPGFLSRNQRLEKNPLNSVIEFYLCLDWVSGYEASQSEKDYFSSKWPWIKPFLPNSPLEDRV